MISSIIKKFERYQQPIHIAPLVTFRIAFGAMMFISILRFWANGWIIDLYEKPTFYFSYMGFDWVQPLGHIGMHIVFSLIAVSALLIALGLFYRVAIVSFFFLFTYVELLDVTNYLNHYYFISIVSFLMIWLPANRLYAIDCVINPTIKRYYIPLWIIGTIRLQLAIVYIFAGLAKLNADWLLEALPMKIWLPAKTHLPIVGVFMYEEWVAYLFSWFGAVYDLFIVFFLLNKKTRPVAYLFVLGFHIATAIFFPAIGMFPYVMIMCSLVFFSATFHRKLLKRLFVDKERTLSLANTVYYYPPIIQKVVLSLLSVYFALQLLIPVRFLLYPDRLFWNEEGYRFSWRVMLMEKSGNTFFYVKEPSTARVYEVDNNIYLTSLQEKMMSTQPDMILQYAHYLAKKYKEKGVKQPNVYVESYVTLNGRPSRLFIDSTVDLTTKKISFFHYDWVLPYNENKK